MSEIINVTVTDTPDPVINVTISNLRGETGPAGPQGPIGEVSTAALNTAIATRQPLDSDLTAIAALTTTTFGRSLLTQADAPATRSTIGINATNTPYTPTGGIAATNVQAAITELDGEKQPIDADLTAIAALTTTSFGRSLLTQADATATRNTIGVNALNTPSTATGNVSATTVQGAINQLESQKAPTASPTFTGSVVVPPATVNGQAVSFGQAGMAKTFVQNTIPELTQGTTWMIPGQNVAAIRGATEWLPVHPTNNNPLVSAGNFLSTADLWLDSRLSSSGVGVIKNIGRAGSVLDAQNGSSSSSDNNDALVLNHDGVNYVYLPGVAGNYVTVPDCPALDITGDIEIVVRVSADTWTPAAEQYFIGKYNSSTNQRSYVFGSVTSGRLSFRTSLDGTATIYSQTSVIPTLVNGSTYWFKVTVDVDNGASGNTVRFFMAEDQVSEPTTWNQIGSDVPNPGVTSIFLSNSAIELGTISAGASANFIGKVYRSIIRNGIGGTTALDIDFTTGILNGAQTSVPITGIAANQIGSAQVLSNVGSGGSVLNATVGSSPVTTSNDPIILEHDGTNYVYLPGVAGNQLIVGNDTAFNLMGDVEWVIDAAMDDWTPLAAVDLAVRGNADPNRSFQIRLQTNGTIRLTWWPSGSSASGITVASTGIVPFVDRQRGQIKISLDVNNGSGQYVVTMSTSTDNTTWTPLTMPSMPSLGTTSLPSVTSSVGVFFGDYAGAAPFSGKGYRFRMLNGIGGTTVLDVDTSVITSGAATSFTAATGQTVTINRATSGYKTVAVTRPTLLFGIDDYLEVPDHDLLDFGESDSFTVMAAVRQWATPATSGRYLSKGGGGTPSSFILAASGTTQAPQFRMDGAGGSAALATGPTSSSGALRLLTAVRNTTADNVTVYVDGTAGTPVTDTTTGTIGNALSLRIGSDLGAVYQDFEFFGVAVWRRALTAAEIATVNNHYNGTVTTASIALLSEAVLWVDPARSKNSAAIVRSTSGRKAVAVTKNTWLFGTNDYFQIPDNNDLLDITATKSVTIVAVARVWGNAISAGRLVHKGGLTGPRWGLSFPASGSLNRAQGFISDGVAATVTAESNVFSYGNVSILTAVFDRQSQQITAYSDGIAGTPSASISNLNASNSSAMLIGSNVGTAYSDMELMGVLMFPRALLASEIQQIAVYYNQL